MSLFKKIMIMIIRDTFAIIKVFFKLISWIIFRVQLLQEKSLKFKILESHIDNVSL